MALEIRPYTNEDLPQMVEVWNEVVAAGNAFPQEELLTEAAAEDFFAQQTISAVAHEEGRVYGLYILHPNNVGRCGKVANASYAVASASRGKGVGRQLVQDSLAQAARAGFRGLQFNAVVASNTGAIHLYEDLGFTYIGTIPGGFRNNEGVFEDMCIYFKSCLDESSNQ